MNQPESTKALLVNSALWAAYGDALGFATELISSDEFKKRSGGLDSISSLISFSKRVGGLFGPSISFPRGAYSDDTQLRLCTSRAIKADGYFDVECFAKIELPVWLNYALGAGRGSKAAATNLSLRDTNWSLNFFKTGEISYWECGGNGAAMRIQPHVWKSHSGASDTFMPDVVRDAICTHGHLRGIGGAAIHAQFLHFALRSGQIPAPSEWEGIGHVAIQNAFKAILDDEELSLVWIPNWEQYSGRKFEAGWKDISGEWSEAVRVVSSFSMAVENDEAYRQALNELGGYSRAERGSGLKTALYATLLCWLYRNNTPDVALQIAANEFGSDTDTISTMAGALLGLTTSVKPPSAVQDENYITSETERLFDIGAGIRPNSFPYPDLSGWSPPRTQSDAWLIINGEPHLAGLGKLKPMGEVFAPERGAHLRWQWCKLEFGQTILAKRKQHPKNGTQSHTRRHKVEEREPHAPELPFGETSPNVEPKIDPSLTIDEATQHCIRESFDSYLVGAYLMSFCTGPDGIEKAIAFSAILSKAKLARSRRG